jgi:small subunit ribosomal protein S6
MRIYEELFIVKPDAPEEEIDAYVEQVKQLITTGGGTVDKTDKWGVRKLAYRVEKRNEGYYVLLQFAAGPEVVREVERRMRVTDLVLKFITVRIDEKLKKIEKRKKIREKRAKRRPAPVVAAPAAAPGAPGAPMMPGAPAPGHPGEAPAAPATPAAPAAEPVAAAEAAEKE